MFGTQSDEIWLLVHLFLRSKDIETLYFQYASTRGGRRNAAGEPRQRGGALGFCSQRTDSLQDVRYVNHTIITFVAVVMAFFLRFFWARRARSGLRKLAMLSSKSKATSRSASSSPTRSN